MTSRKNTHVVLDLEEYEAALLHALLVLLTPEQVVAAHGRDAERLYNTLLIALPA